MLKRTLLFIFSLSLVASAETTKTIFNPFVGNLDYITKLDSTTAISVATTTITGPLSVTNAPVSGTAGTSSQINTGDPNTRGLILKGNTSTPAGVQPNTVTGLILWLKEDSIVSSNGSAVTTWTDSSGNGNDASSSGSNRPTYQTNIIGGLPSVKFASGSSQFMNGALALTGTNKLTVFMVMQNVTQTSGGSLSISRTGVADSNDVNVAILNYNNNGTDSMLYKFNTAAAITNPANGTPFIYNIIDSGASSTAYLNGATGTTAGVDATNWNVGLYYLGSRYDGATASSFANCYISEVIIYNTNISGTDQQNILAYLANKYMISASGLSTPQVSNLQEWQKSDGTVQTAVSGLGFLKVPQVTPTSDTAEAAGLLARDSSNNLYISTATAAGSWQKVGAQ